MTEDAGILESQRTTALLATIHVVRSIGQLTRTLRLPTISPATLETFERHFNTCLVTFPPQFHPRNDEYLDPRSLAPVIYLQNARLILHRHNISPFSSFAARSSAMDYCVSTSLDTAQLLSRCMRNQSEGDDWRSLLASCAGTLLCTHVWRCMLFLLFRQEYAGALACIQASAAIGGARSVNVSCGQYLSFFLHTLLERLQRGDSSSDLEHDEEMLAYASGDMQGSSDGSWVWQGSETGSQLEAISPVLSNAGVLDHTSRPQDMEWEGWEWIEKTVQYLLTEQQARGPSEPRDVTMGQPQEPAMLGPERAPSDTSDQRSSSAHSRMTIASII